MSTNSNSVDRGETELGVDLIFTPKFLSALEVHHREQAARRAADMPTTKDAQRVLFDAYSRLLELGWRPAMYSPKDGTEFDTIEAGSTGVHRCICDGTVPGGSWWIVESDGMSPSHPILFRSDAADGAEVAR